jgi:hypothetical protein
MRAVLSVTLRRVGKGPEGTFLSFESSDNEELAIAADTGLEERPAISKHELCQRHLLRSRILIHRFVEAGCVRPSAIAS